MALACDMTTGRAKGARAAGIGSTMLRLCVALLCGWMTIGSARAGTCADLVGLRLPNVTITAAQPVAHFTQIAKSLGDAPLAAPFCRVEGIIAPTGDSHIGFEIWLPDPARWNRKLQSVGNGGFLGILNRRASVAPVLRDYAVMTNDLGHVNAPGNTADASWALGHPEKVIDYAWRAEHLATVAAKAIVEGYYGAPPIHAYYTGCSAGGIRGLADLFRFPADYDGYLIGAAHPDHLGQEFGALWNTLLASLKTPQEALRAPQIEMLHAAVLRQCAKAKAVPTDGFLSNPQACRFDVAALICKPGQASDRCLTAAQVAIVQKIYAGPVNPRTGIPILPGIMPGSELTWGSYFTGKTNPAQPDRPWSSFMGYIANTPDYLSNEKYLDFDFDHDIAAIGAKKVGGETLGSSWNASNHDLEAFRRAGGKVIQYHGWDDPNIPPLSAVQLLADVVRQQARVRKLSPAQAEAATADFYRLFMVPGMGHCSGGAGAWAFGQPGQDAAGTGPEYDPVEALERWVEQGVAPERFIGMHAVRGKSKDDGEGTTRGDSATTPMTRPICRYPTVPVYHGSGNPNDAASFTCLRKTTS